tara:strand:- start:9682 stop:9891 length:210 start_codon:yes stop_codon:yes gene_type:complete
MARHAGHQDEAGHIEEGEVPHEAGDHHEEARTAGQGAEVMDREEGCEVRHHQVGMAMVAVGCALRKACQ